MAADKGRGRGPEWDDGLPEVDVEVPDDLSELDREVHAYHREQRKERRQQLFRRFVPGYRRLGPYGVLAPVIAGALIVTAVLGSVLSFLGPRPSQPGRAADAPRDQGAARRQEPGVGQQLPKTAVSVDGRPSSLSRIHSSAVVAVPTNCGCAATIDALTSTARRNDVGLYLSGPTKQVEKLAAREGRYPHVVDGAAPTLASRYRPDGVSAVLVGSGGKVTAVLRNLSPKHQPSEQQLTALGEGHS